MAGKVWSVVACAVLAGCECSKQKVAMTSSELEVDRTAIDFGDVTINTEAVQAFTLKNRGMIPIHVTSLGFEPGDVTVFTLKDGVETVPAGGSVEVVARFVPVVEGVAQVTLRVESDATVKTETVITMVGRGVAQYVLTVQPAELDFGDVLFQTTKSATLRLRNDGTKAFDLSALSLAQLSQFGFNLPVDHLIAPGGGEVAVEVTYTPTMAGAPLDRLVVDGAVNGLGLSVPLKGRCLPKLRVSEMMIDFGTISPGWKKLHGFAVSNVGYAPLTISTALSATTPSVFGVEDSSGMSAGTSDHVLAPSPETGATQTGSVRALQVSFLPTLPSLTYAGELLVTSDDPLTPHVTVPITAKSGDSRCGTTAGFDGEVTNVDVGPQSIYFIGGFGTYDGAMSPHIAKTDLECIADPVFHPGTGFDAAPGMVAATKDGDVVVMTSGAPLRYNGSTATSLAWKLNPDGTNDPTWTTPSPIASSGGAQALEMHAMDDFIIYTTWQSLRVLDLTGAVVFNGTGGINVHTVYPVGARKALLLTRGDADFNGVTAPGGIKLLDFTGTPGTPGFGAIDATFKLNAGTGANASCGISPAVSPDGSHFVAPCTTRWSGSNYGWNGGPDKNKPLFSINVDGTEVASWHPNIVSVNDDGAYPCGIDSQNRVYVFGPISSIDARATTPWRLYRLKSDGSFDAEFPGFDAKVNGCRVLADDRILAFGQFTHYASAAAGRIAFLHANGTKY